MRLFLTLLVLIGSTTTSVRHDHAGGRTLHGHGPALALVHATGTGSGLGEDTCHRHFVVLGIEFFETDCPHKHAASPSDQLEQFHVLIGDWDDRADASRLLPLAPDEGAFDLAVWPELVVFHSLLFPPRPPAPPGAAPPARRSLSDRARGARSGVLNA